MFLGKTKDRLTAPARNVATIAIAAFILAALAFLMCAARLVK